MLSYRLKPTVTRAPDSYIQIQQSDKVTLCSNCKAQINISDYITEININQSTHGTVGTASVNLSFPKHGLTNNYMVRGSSVYGIKVTNEISIYLKGSFKDKNNEYPYYKVFWGVITSISENYTPSNQTITLSCSSMLKWLELTQTLLSPASQVMDYFSNFANMSTTAITGKTFGNLNAFEMVYSLFEISFLNMVIPLGYVAEVRDDLGKILPPVTKADEDLITAWRTKFFESILGNLKMFGVKKEDIRDTLAKKKSNLEAPAVSGNQNIKETVGIAYDSTLLLNFKPFLVLDDPASFDYIQNNYKNNLELLQEIKSYTGYEIYQDMNGEFIFKPPFWNVDVKKNKYHTISDKHILNWTWMESDDVVTRYEVRGNFAQTLVVSNEVPPLGVFTDYKLARTYGIRPREETMRFITDADLCYIYAISQMDIVNSKRFSGSMTLIGRPELKLGLPVYIESKDMFGYIDEINHSFSFGSNFTTSISLSAIRKKYLFENEKETLNKNAPEYTIKGSPKVLVYTSETGDRGSKNIQYQKRQNEIIEQGKSSSAEVIEINTPLFRTNRSGIYKEYDLEKDKNNPELKNTFKLLNNILKKQSSIDKNKDNTSISLNYLKILETLIPVSDEEGYDLIGIFENGRSFYLDNDWILRKKDTSISTILAKNIYPNDKDESVDIIPPINDILTNDFLTSSKEQKSRKLSEITPTQKKSNSTCSCNFEHMKNQPKQTTLTKTIKSK